jgi:C4-dicarboxylate-specific signal transduction histidine kinase
MLLMRREDNGANVSLELELMPELSPILGDRVRLRQVIINLAMDGIEAMADAVDDRRKLVVQSRRGDDDDVVVGVRDFGSGILSSIEQKLFNPFFTTKANGMGMGLSICRSIVEEHGGLIWAARNEDHGTTFAFSIKAAV